jgi:hypothetical protein
MKNILFAIAAAAMLSACASNDVKPVLDQLNSNIAKNCDVHIAGSIGGGAVGIPASTVTFQMDCKPHDAPIAPAPAAAVNGGIQP